MGDSKKKVDIERLEQLLEESERDKKKIRSRTDTIVKNLQRNGLNLSRLEDELKNDKTIVMAAVQQNGLALQYASEALRGDEEIVMAAVQQNAGALEHASDRLKDTREVVLKAVENNGLAIALASERLGKDKYIAMTAIKQNPNAVKYMEFEPWKDEKELSSQLLNEIEKKFSLGKSDTQMQSFIAEKKKELETLKSPTAFSKFNMILGKTMGNLTAHQAQVKTLQALAKEPIKNQGLIQKGKMIEEAMFNTPIEQRNSKIAPALKKALNTHRDFKAIPEFLRGSTKTTTNFKEEFKKQRESAEKEVKTSEQNSSTPRLGKR